MLVNFDVMTQNMETAFFFTMNMAEMRLSVIAEFLEMFVSEE